MPRRKGEIGLPQTTLDEFGSNAAQSLTPMGTQSNNEPLEFTGNWFIDAGILGFVNLMEEVYGWDLETLQNEIQKEPKQKIEIRFTYAFWYKRLWDKIPL